MRRTIACSVALVGLLVAAGSFAADPVSKCGTHRGPKCSEPEVMAPWDEVLGRTYAEWSAAWWRWALYHPLAAHPIEDPDGGFQDSMQRGRVWFLGGTSGGSAERSVTVPRGKAVLFPVLTSVWVTFDNLGDDPFSVPGSEVFARSQIGMDPLAELEVIVDDLNVGLTDYDGAYGPLVVENDLRLYRAASPVFRVYMPEENWFDQWIPAPGGLYGDCVADGYWFLVDDLCPGEHTIYFKGVDTRNGFEVEVTYHLTVE